MLLEAGGSTQTQGKRANAAKKTPQNQLQLDEQLHQQIHYLCFCIQEDAELSRECFHEFSTYITYII